MVRGSRSKPASRLRPSPSLTPTSTVTSTAGGTFTVGLLAPGSYTVAVDVHDELSVIRDALADYDAYVAIDADAEDIATKLTMGGLEVEGNEPHLRGVRGRRESHAGAGALYWARFLQGGVRLPTGGESPRLHRVPAQATLVD